MSTFTSVDPVSPAVAEFMAKRELATKQKLETEALAQRWPMSPEVRSQVIKTALGLCGLEMSGEGQVKPAQGATPPKERIRLGAMRVMASFDRLSIQQRKLELLENPSGEEPVRKVDDMFEVSPELADKILEIVESAPPPPEPTVVQPVDSWKKKADLELARRALRQRWPISMAVRGQIIVAALSLCGFAVRSDGQVEPIAPIDDTPPPPPKPRIVLAALRVLAALDRLSIEERRVELRAKLPKNSRPDRPQLHPDVAAKIYELISRI
jgi:hypothetical protein